MGELASKNILSEDVMLQDARRTRRTIIILSLVMIVFASFFGLLLTRSITRPLIKVSGILKKKTTSAALSLLTSSTVNRTGAASVPVVPSPNVQA